MNRSTNKASMTMKYPIIFILFMTPALAFAQTTIEPASTLNSENTTMHQTEPQSNAAPKPAPIPSKAEWFSPDSIKHWYSERKKQADRDYLGKSFASRGYKPPENSYALVAPIRLENGRIMMKYYSYGDTAFQYSMTEDGRERYWPASTVKLTAAVMALVKLNQMGFTSQASIQFDDIEGHYDGTVEKLCRDAIIPSSNTGYNRLMEIAGFDESNDHVLPEVFHFPTMILQRRYARQNPDDNLRVSPAMTIREGEKTGQIPERRSSGRIRPQCPREANCTTLAELAETMFRVVFHKELPENYRFKLNDSDVRMLHQALLKAPSCIGPGIESTLGTDAVIYNKGGKVIGDDRLEIAVVSTHDKTQMYLVALSMPYYEGVEKETAELARQLIVSMQTEQ